MQHQHPYQCDICFQPYSPFTIMCVLPVTTIIALSSTATPIHVRTPGAHISVCRHCLQSYSNLEPCTDPANTPDTSNAPDVPDALVLPASPDTPDASDPLKAPKPLALPASPNTPESLETPDALSALSPSPSQYADEGLLAKDHREDAAAISCTDMIVSRPIHPIYPIHPKFNVALQIMLSVQKSVAHSVTFATFATFSLCNGIRSPPL